MSDISRVTLLIKTFSREKCLIRLLKSIRKYYPTIQVLIVDDGEEEMNYPFDKYTDYHHVNFDIGLSAGRNYGMDLINTEFFILLDDDYKFIRRTKVERFLELIEKHDLDVLGGRWLQNGTYRGYEYNLELRDNQLFLVAEPLEQLDKDVDLYDMVLNFFIARTQKIRTENRWDEKLKLVEHTDFFLNGKAKGVSVGYCSDIVIKHVPVRNRRYNKFRKSVKPYLTYMQDKWNYTVVVRPEKSLLMKWRGKIMDTVDIIMARINGMR